MQTIDQSVTGNYGTALRISAVLPAFGLLLALTAGRAGAERA